MDIKKVEKRDTAMDITRIVAIFTVISVHFFLNNGFYDEPITGTTMYIGCLMRTLFGVCVPLFILLTGYFMSQKTLNRKYYLGITKTLVIYLLASVACIIYKSVHLHNIYTFKSFILSILDFSGSNYSWYIEMYIGLFLLIPFLNLIYNNLESQKHKQILVWTLFCLTILPSMFNIFNFETSHWWAVPSSSDIFSKIVPAWWINFYPITYYFVGCYLREYGLKIKTKTLLLLFFLCTICFCTFNYYRSYGTTTFKTSMYIFWYGFQPFFLSVLLFTMLSRINGKKIPIVGRFILWKISDLALPMYLVSFIFDNYFYPELNKAINPIPSRIMYYFIMVPLVFFCSMLLSVLIVIAQKIIFFSIPKLWNYFKTLVKNSSINKQTILFFILMTGAIIFSFWKCSYGFGGNDEAFYLTTAHRLSLGDSLLSDEWHLSQFSGFLLLPFVSLYRLIMGSTEGILLTARFTYVILHAAITFFSYNKIKKIGYMSVIACVLYFIFTPYDIMALSYNTMALDLLVLTGIIMSTSKSHHFIPVIISGIAFSSAVLCCPYLAVAYLLYGICVITNIFFTKRNCTKTIFSEKIFSPQIFLWFTCGVVFLALIFLTYLFIKVSPAEIFANIPGIFTDPEHPPISIGTKLKLYFSSVYNCHPHFNIAIITYGIMLISMSIDRNRKNHRCFYLICTCTIVIFSYILFLPELITKYYNAIIFPMLFIGLTSYILCENKPRKQFISLFMLGIIYSVCVCFSSNQYFYVISMATAISNIASFIFLGTLLNEVKEREDEVAWSNVLRISSVVMVSFMIVLLCFFQTKIKANHCFWESNPDTLSTKIKSGPAKGLYTNSKNASTYESICNDLQEYKNKKRDNILILSERTWCYLYMTDFPYGTLSAWLPETDASLARLVKYYSLNPNKIPAYIYIPKDSKWDISDIIATAQSKNYQLVQSETSYKLSRLK